MDDVIAKALYRGEKTLISEIGDMSKVCKDKFKDGKGKKYLFGDELKDSFIMPGMEKSISKHCASGEFALTTDMVPQGICNYGGYIFTTAYSKSGDYCAVVYVYDVASKEYITTLIMHKASHAGGVEYVEGNLWIGDTGAYDTGYLFYYDFNQIAEAIKCAIDDKTITAVDMTGFNRGCINLGKGNKASFLTNYNGYLCVGEYMKNVDSVGRLTLYDPTALLDEVKKTQRLITIPANANGVMFGKNEDKSYMVVTANVGRMANSSIHIFEIKERGGTMAFEKIKTMEMPCMIEEATLIDGKIYFVFESCANAYRKKIAGKSFAKHIVGRVCGFDKEFIFG